MNLFYFLSSNKRLQLGLLGDCSVISSQFLKTQPKLLAEM